MEQIFFRLFVNRDFIEPCFYLRSASVRIKQWPRGASISTGLSHDAWQGLEARGLIAINSYTSRSSLGYGFNASIDFELTQAGCFFIAQRVVELNRRLLEVLRGVKGPSTEEILLAEEQVLNLDLKSMDRYIRTR
jgi:hypothetical protein